MGRENRSTRTRERVRARASGRETASRQQEVGREQAGARAMEKSSECGRGKADTSATCVCSSATSAESG
eukprot:6196117-Pleurochrysis_carterae.AAC.1